MQITPQLAIPDEELTVSFVRASGPGGQNVNKVSTAVQLRFDVGNSSSLTEEVKARLRRLAGARMTQNGVLQIEAKRYRTQERNRAEALQRFCELVRRAAQPPKKRRPTRPSRASQVRRVEAKKRRGAVKRIRQSKSEPET
jgi:ribosome-associated protein